MIIPIFLLTYLQNGDTALHIAAAMGRRKLTRVLLESACNKDVKNKVSWTKNLKIYIILTLSYNLPSLPYAYSFIPSLDGRPVTLFLSRFQISGYISYTVVLRLHGYKSYYLLRLLNHFQSCRNIIQHSLWGQNKSWKYLSVKKIHEKTHRK